MSNYKSKVQNIIQKPPTKIKKNQVKKNRQKRWLWVSAILLLTLISFYPSIKCDFTSWDDPLYVTENNLIKNLYFENIKNIFSTGHAVALNYHPLTVLSFAIDFHFSGLNPLHYHLVNVIIHLLNTLLVFFFAFKLSNGKLFVGIIVSLFFGIHPMHVESVTWISERKDVLYAFFFIASLICYLNYTQSNKTKFLIFTFILFFLSILSKAMAVVLPVVLILIDYYQGRKLTIKTLAEKIPFFIVSLIFGLLAINIQSKEAIATYETFTLFQRISFGFFGFFTYIWKMILPIDLSAFYPYPIADSQIAFPISFYLPVIIGLILFITIPLLTFFYPAKMKLISFGIGFYFITIVFVLQFISVGQVIMAERYSYIPYIGLLFLIGMLLNNLTERKPLLKKFIFVVISGIAILFSYLTHERTKVWKTTETLWTDVINKYPHPPWNIEIAYVGRGRYYASEKNDLEKALSDFNTLLSMKTKNATVYNNLGNIYAVKGQDNERMNDLISAKQNYEKSLNYFKTSLSLDSNAKNTYVNRATAYIFMKNYELAANDFNKALKYDNENFELIEKRAYAYYKSRKWSEAKIDYDFLISKFPEKTYFFQYRGYIKFNLEKFNEGIQDLLITVQREPQNETAYYYLSLCYYSLNDYMPAFKNAERAIQFNYKVDQNYLNMLRSKIK